MRLLPVLLLSAVACTSGTPAARPSPSAVPASETPSVSPSPTTSPSPARTASPTPKSTTAAPVVTATPKATATSPRPVPTAAPVQRLAVPETFVAVTGTRLGVYSSRTGDVVRWLTPEVKDIGLPALSADKKQVYFVEVKEERGNCPATYRMPVAGGARTFVRSGQEGGGQPIAVGPGGALAGHTWCIASMFVVWSKGGTKGQVSGTRNQPANGLSWSPDATRLAISTVTEVRVVTLPADDLMSGGVPPCPIGLPGCRTRNASFGPDGSLYYVAVAAGGARAEVVRLRGGAATSLFRLPKASRAYRVFAAPSGALLVSGDADTGSGASDFALTWDGVDVRPIARQFIQPAW